MALLPFSAALAAALGSGELLTMNSSISTLASPWATATISFADIPDPQEDDRLAVVCVSGYYQITTVYWQRVSAPVVAGSEQVPLFAGANTAGCPHLAVAYYQEIDLIAVTEPIATAPMVQQVRLSLTNDPATAVVDWVSTLGAGTTGLVAFGESAGALNSSAPAVESDVPNVGKVCYALLSGLRADTRYFYRVFDGVAQSAVTSFLHRPAVTPDRPQRIAIFADFGVEDGFGLAQIVADANSGAFDLVLHAGDWAYDFYNLNSTVGNVFLNRAMMYSSQVPTNPAIGNHEVEGPFNPAGAAGREYDTRHPGVARYSNTVSALP